ncbi:adenylosuccinate lyase [Anaerovorax odorimutans]|uniref:adenylosuccinate lyase n=1 Tax=Anaerovorax odorimutans TaxID=109327 RepID=UPI0004155EF9|nr:adenylosuccinate lyase [Anaerovorax odorimutans]
MSKDLYENPLITRYTSKEMSHIFSSDVKFSTWRKLWIALAEAEKELGLPINDEQIEELKKFQNNINYEDAEKREKETRHDVMSHVYAYGLQCPKAAPIIHLGATSAYVGDNTDIIVMKQGLELVREKLISLMNNLSNFALKNKSVPTLGFTHFQAAQLTTVGKRAGLWLQDFYFDYIEITRLIETLPLLGVKGTTGTQASFVELFDGDMEKVNDLEKRVIEKLGFDNVVALSGQTYTRKIDYMVLSALSGIGQSAHKMTNDIRLLQHLKEVEEPFESKQIGSSAMAYKRNPMRSERVASLARYAMNLAANTADTASTQWFERTLDDSANRRISIPQSFMSIDGILDICRNVTAGLIVHEKVILQRIMSEIPFMATENILMEAVKKGGNRQELHERIREHSMKAGSVVKDEGKPNDLLERIANDPVFGLSVEDVKKLLDPKDYIGRSADQIEQFVEEHIRPIITENKNCIGGEVDLKV